MNVSEKSKARLVQRKTGAYYQTCLQKIRREMAAGGLEQMRKYVAKVEELPDLPDSEEYMRCVECLEFDCTCAFPSKKKDKGTNESEASKRDENRPHETVDRRIR